MEYAVLILKFCLAILTICIAFEIYDDSRGGEK